MHGEGQTIAIFEYTDFDDNDIATFDDASSGFPRRTYSVFRLVAELTCNDAQPEAELDIELVHSIAPAARLLVYEAPNSDTGRHRPLEPDRQ